MKNLKPKKHFKVYKVPTACIDTEVIFLEEKAPMTVSEYMNSKDYEKYRIEFMGIYDTEKGDNVSVEEVSDRYIKKVEFYSDSFADYGLIIC